MKLRHWPKFQVAQILSFYMFYLKEIGLILLYSWFSKLPYLGMKLGGWQKFQKLHMHSLSSPCACFCSRDSCFWDNGWFSKLSYSGMNLGHCEKRYRSCTILSFYLRWSKLSLFLLYRQRIPRYGRIFKIAIFEHELEHWPISSRSCTYIMYMYTLFSPGGGGWGAKMSLFLTCFIWAWINFSYWTICSRSCTYTP